MGRAKFLGDVKAAVFGEAGANWQEQDERAQEKMEVMDAINADSVVVEMVGASEQYLTQLLLEAQALT